MAEQDFDIGIGYGANTIANMDSHPLPPDDIFPVCSPSLLADLPLNKPEDLLNHTILRSVSPVVDDDWSIWLAHVCRTSLNFPREMNFSGLFLPIEAALHGLGVCMGRSWLVRKELADGSLIMPFQYKVRLDASYFLIHKKDHGDVEKIRVFREWLLNHFSKAAM